MYLSSPLDPRPPDPEPSNLVGLDPLYEVGFATLKVVPDL
jgi:hypothetical protein